MYNSVTKLRNEIASGLCMDVCQGPTGGRYRTHSVTTAHGGARHSDGPSSGLRKSAVPPTKLSPVAGRPCCMTKKAKSTPNVDPSFTSATLRGCKPETTRMPLLSGIQTVEHRPWETPVFPFSLDFPPETSSRPAEPYGRAARPKLTLPQGLGFGNTSCHGFRTSDEEEVHGCGL